MERPGYTLLAFLFIAVELAVLYFSREFGWGILDTGFFLLVAPVVAAFLLIAFGLVLAAPLWLLYKGFSK